MTITHPPWAQWFHWYEARRYLSPGRHWTNSVGIHSTLTSTCPFANSISRCAHGGLPQAKNEWTCYSEDKSQSSHFHKHWILPYSILLLYDWRVKLNKDFVNRYNVVFSTVVTLQAPSTWSCKDKSYTSKVAMTYYEPWGNVRKSNHFDITWSFDDYPGWLSSNWCISSICEYVLIGVCFVLFFVVVFCLATFVKWHFHYNQILLCNWSQYFKTWLNICSLMHQKLLLYSL